MRKTLGQTHTKADKQTERDEKEGSETKMMAERLR